MLPTREEAVEIQQFEKEGHVIVWGDAIDALSKLIPDESVDLVFADPPYNIGKSFGDFKDRWPSDESYAEWCKEWLSLLISKLKPNGSLYVMCSTQSLPYLDLLLRRRIEVLSRIVWSYDSSGVQARRYYGSMWEPILHCVKDKKDYKFNAKDIEVEARTGATRKLIDYRGAEPRKYSSTKVPGNVWNFPRVRYRMVEYEDHPSQKPEQLIERVVRASSDAGDLVLDPFSGTFTTSAVAKRLGRRSIGIETQEKYIKVGLRRVGVASTFRGEELHPPKKSYEQKNGRAQKKTEKSDNDQLAM